MKKINLYTDGACSGNPGPGGWGAILVFNGTEKEFSGGSENTTNNQMELLAVIEGLKALKQPCEVHIVSDSKYVIQAIQEWLPNWKKNNWIGSNKKEIKNVELWQEFDLVSKNHVLTLEWVKGHAGHPMNERCDKLATMQRDFHK